MDRESAPAPLCIGDTEMSRASLVTDEAEERRVPRGCKMSRRLARRSGALTAAICAAVVAAAMLLPAHLVGSTKEAALSLGIASHAPDMSVFSPHTPDSSSSDGDRAGGALREGPRGVGAGVAVGAVPAPASRHAPSSATVGAAWRWRQYITQRPAWRASHCSPEVLALAADITAPRALVECATVRAPLDWSDLTAGSITLAVTRVRDSRSPAYPSAARPANRRLLLVNPGGPGVVADWLAPVVAARTGTLPSTHDIVAVDPRGSGGSTPIVCPVVYDGLDDLRGVDAAGLAAMQAAARATVKGCMAANGRLLRHLSSDNMAGDLDLVRRVLGRTTTDFYGISAGTWLAARYARRYPAYTGRFVLDGNTEFSATWRESFAWQPMGIQRRLEQQFYPWAARHHRVYGLGATPEAVRRSHDTARSALASGRLTEMTPRAFDKRTAEALYQDSGFLTLAETLRDMRRRAGVPDARAAAGASRPARASVGEHEADPQETVYMAVQCNDSGRTAADSHAAEGRILGAAYPLLGHEWLTSPCAYWPWPATAPASSRPLPAMLMVQTELDPATPWEGALRAHRANPATRLVGIEDQGSHGAYLSENACVIKAVNAYLVRGTLPARDVVCPGVSLPLDARTYPMGRSPAGALR